MRDRYQYKRGYKMKQQKYKYFKTLSESVQLTIKNPKILLPLIISWIAGLFLIPWIVKLQDQAYLMENIREFITFYAVIFIFGIVIYGWTFCIINQALTKKKIELGKAFKRSFSFGLRTFALYAIATISIALIYALTAAVILLLLKLMELINLPILGAILGLVIGALFLVLLLLIMAAALQLTPVLLVEDKGVIETVKMTMRFYFRKKIYSLNIFLVSFISMMILSMPMMIYHMAIMAGALASGQPALYTTSQMLISDMLSLLPSLFFAVLIVYYSKSYIIKKATIKGK
jgi:MFS family permease